MCEKSKMALSGIMCILTPRAGFISEKSISDGREISIHLVLEGSESDRYPVQANRDLDKGYVYVYYSDGTVAQYELGTTIPNEPTSYYCGPGTVRGGYYSENGVTVAIYSSGGTDN